MSKARFVFFTNSFSRRYSDTANRHQRCTGRDAPPIPLSVLQVSQGPQGRGTGPCALHRSLLWTPRYHHVSTTATATSSMTEEETFYPSGLQITNCQVGIMTPSSTLRKSTIEVLINSNQYQVLCLKWATGSKLVAAELRFSSKYWGYNG